MFLTDAHHAFIQEYCRFFANALRQGNGQHVIDLDAVADAVKSVEKPPFYYAATNQ